MKSNKTSTTEKIVGVAQPRLVRPFRLTDGKRFTNPKGGWIEISWQCGNLVCYNQSGGCYWQGGRLQCTKTKFRKMLSDGNYLANAKHTHGAKNQ